MTVDRGGGGSVGVYHSAVVNTNGRVVVLRSLEERLSSPQEAFPYVQEQAVPSMARNNNRHSSPVTARHQWSKFFHRNAVQRIISAVILAPAVTVFLWLSPAFATTTVCSFMISTCSYEYACLANRIRLRILTQMEALEGPLDGRTSERRFDNNTSLHDTQSNHSISSETEEAFYRSLMAGAYSFNSAVRPRTTRSSQPDARAIQEERENREIAIVHDELRNQEDRIHRCAVTGLAVRYFEGHVWWTAACVSVPVCVVIAAGFLFSIQLVSEFESTEFYEY